MSAKRSTATEQRYLREAEHFLRWYRTSYGAAMTAQEFTDETLERYFAWCRPRYSPSAQRRRRSALQWFGDWLKLAQQIEKNPLRKDRRRKTGDGANHPPSPVFRR